MTCTHMFLVLTDGTSQATFNHHFRFPFSFPDTDYLPHRSLQQESPTLLCV